MILALLLVTSTTIKIDAVQSASDGGYIISAVKGYTFDAECQHPHWYFETYNPIDLFKVMQKLRLCYNKYPSINKDKVYDDE